MSHEDNAINVNANVVSKISVESRNITNVEDIPGVSVPKPKKSKWASNRGVTKRGSLGDDETFTPTKPSIDNDGSDNVVELTNIPQELHDLATNVTTDVAVTSIPLDTTIFLFNPSRTTNLTPQHQRQVQHNVSLRTWTSSTLLNHRNGANLTWAT